MYIRQLLRYDLLDECGRVSEDREALKIMSQLDLLSYPSLRVYKNEMMHWDEQWAYRQRIVNARTRDLPREVLKMVSEIGTYR